MQDYNWYDYPQGFKLPLQIFDEDMGYVILQIVANQCKVRVYIFVICFFGYDKLCTTSYDR